MDPTTLRRKRSIAVVGGSDCDQEIAELARRAGRAVADADAILVCGGLGGVMEHAARGAKEGGGLTIGILPGEDPREANPYIDLPIATGLGHARNLILVRTCHALVAVDGSYGTLSEITFALLHGKPVVGVRTWEIDPKVRTFEVPEEAVRALLEEL